jgi:DNA-binding NtrC family response regulator
MSISQSASSTFTFSAVASPLAGDGEPAIIGSSAAMKHLRLQVQRIGPHFRTVLISGEAGTEKELVARALHGLSPTVEGPLVTGHAAKLEEALAECEARTTATFRATLFLDAVNELPLEMQDRLLPWLKKYESAQKLDGSRRTDSRLIASTSEDLRVLVSTGRFRQEVYRRLAEVEIVVPPLRERMEDLPELASCFLGRIALQHGRVIHEIADEATERMQGYDWLGNTDELESVLREGVLKCAGAVLECRHLPVLGGPRDQERSTAGAGGSVRLQDVVDRHVLRVLKDCGGNKLRAAEVLGISRSTLYRMLDARAPAVLSR